MNSDKQIVCQYKHGVAEFFEVGSDVIVTADNFCLPSVADAQKMMPRYKSAPNPNLTSSFDDSDSDSEEDLCLNPVSKSLKWCPTIYEIPPMSVRNSTAEIACASVESLSLSAPMVSIADEGQSAHSKLHSRANLGKATIDWSFDYGRVATKCHMTCPSFYIDGCPFKVMLHPASSQEKAKKGKNKFNISEGRVLVCLKASSSTAPNLTLSIKVGDQSVVEDKVHDFSQKPTLNLNQEIDLNVGNYADFASKWVKLSFDFTLR